MSVQFIKIQFSWHMPFLSGQISAKCFKSSDGLSSSIGMQYLGEKRSISTTVDMVKN